MPGSFNECLCCFEIGVGVGLSSSSLSIFTNRSVLRSRFAEAGEGQSVCHSAALTRRGTLGTMRRARAVGLVSIVTELYDEVRGKGRETVSMVSTCKIEALWRLR